MEEILDQLNIPLFTGLYTSQVVFLARFLNHQPYDHGTKQHNHSLRLRAQDALGGVEHPHDVGRFFRKSHANPPRNGQSLASDLGRFTQKTNGLWKKCWPARWFKVTFSSPNWRSLNPWKGSLNHPKKVTLNHQGFEFTWPEIKGENVRDLKVKGMKLGFLAAESPGWYESKGPKPREKTKVTPKLCHGFTIPNRLQKIAR